MERVKMIASDGMILVSGESYGREVFLGSGDSPDNWLEITEQEWEHRMEKRRKESLYEENLY